MVTKANQGSLNGSMLRVGEAAKLIHVHPNTLRKWANRGLIRAYRIGERGDRRFYVSDLFSLMRWFSG